MSQTPKKLDVAAARARLNGTRGREFWRNLEELAGTPEFQDLIEREFPRQAIGWGEDESPVEGRRNFLKLMGASLALAAWLPAPASPPNRSRPIPSNRKN